MDAKTLEMFKNDKYYDRKSLVFENGILSEVKDAADRENVPEGRFGEFMSKKVKTKLGVTLRLPVTKSSKSLENAVEAENSDREYRIETDDRFLSIEKLSLSAPSEAEAELSADCDLVKTAEDDYSRFGFVRTTKGETMIGIVNLICRSGDEVYLLKYAGTGNFTDIRMEYDEILFSVKKK